ncbi:hypothetical protein WKH03_09660 [Pantoea agglomerans]|uniref:hypothetical protein n=1 Tax=Enterobacter agglomerans TaxID=549 RepID=UPI003C7BB715
MSGEIKKRFEIPAGHVLEQVSMEWKGVRKGRDVDEYVFNQIDESGNIVATYDEIHSTSAYPPFTTSITVNKR